MREGDRNRETREKRRRKEIWREGAREVRNIERKGCDCSE